MALSFFCVIPYGKKKKRGDLAREFSIFVTCYSHSGTEESTTLHVKNPFYMGILMQRSSEVKKHLIATAEVLHFSCYANTLMKMQILKIINVI